LPVFLRVAAVRAPLASRRAMHLETSEALKN